MTGKQLLEKYTSQKDGSGSIDDQYAQLLMTLYVNINDKLYPFLERAEAEGKSLAIAENSWDADEFVEDDIILV